MCPNGTRGKSQHVLRGELEQVEGVLETLNEGVIVSDDGARILSVNSRFEGMIGRLGVGCKSNLYRDGDPIASGYAPRRHAATHESFRHREHENFGLFFHRSVGSYRPGWPENALCRWRSSTSDGRDAQPRASITGVTQHGSGGSSGSCQSRGNPRR